MASEKGEPSAESQGDKGGQASDPRKAEALAALTIACMVALDAGTHLTGFLGALAGVYASGARIGSEEGDTVVLAVTVAHEAGVSLEDLLDIARLTWEAIVAERANPSPDED